jgi:hypothetical protein
MGIDINNWFGSKTNMEDAIFNLQVTDYFKNIPKIATDLGIHRSSNLICRMNRVLYNVTLSVDESVHEAWLDWMMFVHIPEVMKTGFFLENRICRIHEEEEGGITYAVQYIARSKADLEEYQRDHAPALQQSHNDLYGKHVAAFRTILEIIHESKAPFVDVNPN